MGYDQKTLDRFRKRLLNRRHFLVTSILASQSELASLKGQTRPAELEENAQSSSAEFVLAGVSDTQRNEIALIDSALARIDAGTYGECVDCCDTISIERLEVVPYALRDALCTEQFEKLSEPGREYPTL